MTRKTRRASTSKAISMTVTHSHSSAMMRCRCGDVFHESGESGVVRHNQQKWEAAHRNCVAKPRDARKVFWLSFCDSQRPKGKQFLGACIIEVTAEEAEDALIDVMLQFPWLVCRPSAANHLRRILV